MGRLSLVPPQEEICEEPIEYPCREGLNGVVAFTVNS